MAFDPDKYLEEEFDPDKYLSEFNPDKYLANTKRKTTIREDIGIGLTNIGHAGLNAGDLLLGAAARIGGNEKRSDEVFDRLVARQKADKEEAAMRDQGVGGELISLGTSLAPMLIAAPFTGALAAAGTLVGANTLSQSAENVQAGASDAGAITQAVGEAGLNMAAMNLPIGKGFVKGMGWGVGGNVAAQAGTDVLGNITMPKEAQDPYHMEFDLETAKKYGMAAAGGAMVGGPFGRINRNGALEAKPTPKLDLGVAPEFVDKMGGMSKSEYDELHTAQKNMDDKVQAIHNDINKVEAYIGKTGDASPEHVELLTKLENDLNQVVSKKVELEAKMSGDITGEVTTEQQVKLDARKEQLIQQIKEQRQARSNTEDTPFIPEEFDDTIKKTPPVEMALIKIDEAMLESPEQVRTRMDNAMEKLNALEERRRTGVPGEDYDALYTSLNREIDAYASILEGKKPDLSWAEGTPEKPIVVDGTPLPVEVPIAEVKPIVDKVTPTSNEMMSLLRDKITMREVFDTLISEKVGTRAQQVLLKLLNNIPHIKSAMFKIGAAQEIPGKPGHYSTGQYDMDHHLVELHMGGNLKTILHESVHAATHALLLDKTNPAAIKLQQLYELAKSQNKDSTRHGFTDVHEFVSEAFTNSEFQKILEKMESITTEAHKSSVWDDFRNIIKQAIAGITGEVRLARTALDDVFDAGTALMDTAATKSESFFQKLSDKIGETPPVLEVSDVVTPKTMRGAIRRNFFGKNALEGQFRNHPMVQKVFRTIREAEEESARIQNQWWHNTANVIDSGKMRFWETLTKVKEKGSAIIAVMETPDESMAKIHDVFKQGFEEGLEYKDTLAKHGQNLSPEEVKTYNTLSDLYARMYKDTVAVQQKLGKKHELPYREGWYPAKRVGQFSVELSYGGNLSRVETFKTRRAAEVFRSKITDGKNLKFLEVSDILDASKKEEVQPNKVMADIISETLAKKYPNASEPLQKTIDDLLFVMNSRGGKVGYHHQFRTNVAGYAGSGLFQDRGALGKAFKEGIQAEVNNYGMNLKSLIIKTKLANVLEDGNFREQDPQGHAISEQMYESALGRNKEFLPIDEAANKVANVVDSSINHLTMRVFGKEYTAKEGTALSKLNNGAMRAFYATKMMAKPVFLLAQLLTTPMIIPEMARDNHGIRAFYSFGKGVTKLLTGDKVLWDNIKEVSQHYNVVEAQFLESMNLDRHTGKHGVSAKIVNAIEDYVLLGAVGKKADSISRLVSYATAYTHFTDLGLPSKEASYKARLLTDKAMNVYNSADSAPIFEKMGFIGTGMKPLMSFGLNQLGNVVSYYREAKRGNQGPLIAYGLVSVAIGGLLSLPFISEYERFRQIAEKFLDVQIPSILEIFSGDESFLDRLEITSQDAKDVALYGVPALSGIDLSSSIRSNETIFSLLAAIALGQEDASKLLPILAATGTTAMALPDLAKAVAGESSVGAGKKAVEALVSGPVGYGIKEGLGLNTTKVMGENTDMIAAGKKGGADIERTGKDVAAGLLGTKSIEQRRGDETLWQVTSREKNLEGKKEKATTMYVETGDKKYLDKMIELGMTTQQIQDSVETGAYVRLAPQLLTHFRNKNGVVNKEKAMGILNFGIKK